jgi:hypothetical protein
MTWEWWLKHIDGSKSYIHVVCKICNFLSDTTCIGNLVTRYKTGQGISCLCTGKVPWPDEAKRIQLLSALSEYDVNADEMTSPWWKEHIHDCYSRILVTCNVCTAVCTPTLTDFQSRGGIGCLCRNKTEAKLLKWLNEQCGDVVTQGGECVNPLTERRLRFDFMIDHIVVELDGRIGHFGVNFLGEPCTDHAERDLLKEQWAIANGFSVIRVYQPHVWYDRVDWQGYLLHSFHALKLDTTPRVITQNIPQYTSGIYAQLRTI